MTDKELKMPEEIWVTSTENSFDGTTLYMVPPDHAEPKPAVKYIRADLSPRPAPSAQVEGDVAAAIKVWSARRPLFDCKVEGSGDKTMKEMLQTLIQAAQLPKPEEVTVATVEEVADKSVSVPWRCVAEFIRDYYPNGIIIRSEK